MEFARGGDAASSTVSVVELAAVPPRLPSRLRHTRAEARGICLPALRACLAHAVQPPVAPAFSPQLGGAPPPDGRLYALCFVLPLAPSIGESCRVFPPFLCSLDGQQPVHSAAEAARERRAGAWLGRKRGHVPATTAGRLASRC